MKSVSIISMLSIFLGAAPMLLAGGGKAFAQQDDGETLKYVEFSQLGDPAEVLEVKTQAIGV